MAKTPQKKLLTRRELADVFDVHQQTVTGWEADGLPVEVRGGRGRPSLYKLRDCVRWFVAREVKAVGGDPSAAALSPQVEKARLDQKRREELELKIRERRGELVEAAEVAKEFAHIATTVKARLRAIPDSLADQVAGLKPQAVKALMLARIDDVLRELARGADAEERAS